MKTKMLLAMIVFGSFGLISCSEQKPTEQVKPTRQAQATVEGLESTKSASWEYIVNNAIRAADEYATARNPNAVFIGKNLQIDFMKQVAGDYEGRYLLKIVNVHGENTSFAMLLPLFDEYAPSDTLDDESKLWEVVEAKLNGRSF